MTSNIHLFFKESKASRLYVVDNLTGGLLRAAYKSWLGEPGPRHRYFEFETLDDGGRGGPKRRVMIDLDTICEIDWQQL